MIPRRVLHDIEAGLQRQPAVVLTGARQVGKTTLALELASRWPDPHEYLDLERPADAARLQDPDAYLRSTANRLMVLDEVQRVPELFAVLRGVIDEHRRAGHRTGQFLLLGSASRELISLSSESLAGRTVHVELPAVTTDEAADADITERRAWVRGGYPESLLAPDDRGSLLWREDIITTYLERDIPFFAPRVSAPAVHRLWTMLAHSTSGLLNASALANSLGVSTPTVTRYVDLLVELGLVRRLPPWSVNIGKRVTKTDKVFVRDAGVCHALLGIGDEGALRGHPVAGASWESFCVENICAATARELTPFHYRTAKGDEIDLVLEGNGTPQIAVEVKLSTAPTVSAGFYRALSDIGNPPAYVVHPDTGNAPYPLGDGVTVIGLTPFLRRLREGA